MQSIKALIGCMLALAISEAAFASPMPRQSVSHTVYSVSGLDTNSINESIFTNSPVVVGGQRFAAITNNKFLTSYAAVSTSRGGCEVKNVMVELQSEIVLPQLKQDRHSYAVRGEWDRFISALERHENMHVQNAQRVANEVAARIAQAKSNEPCNSMRPKLDQYVDSLIERRGEWDRELDQKTHHGRTQGAILRPGIR